MATVVQKDGNTTTDVGDEIQYTITVENIGNVTVAILDSDNDGVGDGYFDKLTDGDGEDLQYTTNIPQLMMSFQLHREKLSHIQRHL